LTALRKEILDTSRASLLVTSTFQTQYHDLTAQIQNSWISNYAQHRGLTQLQTLDMKRRDLLRARSYILLVLQVYDLRYFPVLQSNESQQARSEITSNPRKSLAIYTELSNIAKELDSRNEKVWGSMVHLNEYVKTSVKRLWDDLEDNLSTYGPEQFLTIAISIMLSSCLTGRTNCRLLRRGLKV